MDGSSLEHPILYQEHIRIYGHAATNAHVQ